MFTKPSTIVTSAVLSLLHSNKGAQQRQGLLIAAVVVTLVLWKLCTSAKNPAQSQIIAASAEPAIAKKATIAKWSYDELAHKLIVENTDLAYSELGKSFSQGLGRSLNKVARHIDGKPVIVNL
ncbi:hypothetical protein LZD49_05180 [Dyadobacter sp. CY261]|uniref:hypothetical protein n=1 Tax=Dyadobacter sp. CY261 TaxID=2907203 RepID=UPI001F1A7172|nr:hypothetical protein [Dyadobacter sp. CY261]MCF0069854.1 hypothetical protein [Dyadobacter sp. CY261]